VFIEQIYQKLEDGFVSILGWDLCCKLRNQGTQGLRAATAHKSQSVQQRLWLASKSVLGLDQLARPYKAPGS
jgi:hypothetical protein